MYIDKQLKRGYNEYLREDQYNGEGSMMDVGVLLLEAGDDYSFHEEKQELAWVVITGRATAEYDGQSEEIDRPDPFNTSTWCLHQAAGATSKVTAKGPCKIYVQKTSNDKSFPTKVYSPQDTHTWRRGDDICDGACLRDVRTSFDYESAPWSNMVLGEVVNLPGRWSSYPPHDHPQPEVYFYNFEKPQGFGAGWVDGQVTELHDNGLAIITKGTHAMSMAPGYACCYIWGIRHLPGNPWEKTRIDDPAHEWLLDPDAKYWKG